MTIDITPIIKAFVNLLLLSIGLDFIWCGYWFLKTNKLKHLPKFLGYLVLKLFERANKKNRLKNETVNIMFNVVFSMKAASIYMLLEGFNLIARSLLTILTTFQR